MKITTIVGAGPACPAGHCCEVIVHTRQYYDEDMSDRFFEQLNIASPEYNLV